MKVSRCSACSFQQNSREGKCASVESAREEIFSYSRWVCLLLYILVSADWTGQGCFHFRSNYTSGKSLSASFGSPVGDGPPARLPDRSGSERWAQPQPAEGLGGRTFFELHREKHSAPRCAKLERKWPRMLARMVTTVTVFCILESRDESQHMILRHSMQTLGWVELL